MEENIKVVVRIKPLEAGEESCLEAHENKRSICLRCPESEPLHTPRKIPTTPSTLPRTPGRKTPKTYYHTITSFPSLEQLCDSAEMPASPSLTPSKKAAAATMPSTPVPTRRAPSNKIFHFDHVFDENSSQAEVFSMVEPLVQAAVEGYNATIFAYGQTGAGKTHTMMGPRNDPGIIPRAVGKIFEIVNSRTDTLFYIRMSYVELHLDKFIDLLDPDNEPAKRSRLHPEKAREKKIELHEKADKSGAKTVYLTGSDTLDAPVTSYDDALQKIQQGNRCRSTRMTNMNDHSSRSHAILIFEIQSRNANGGSPLSNSAAHSRIAAPVSVGRLYLVDLAGSERLSKSGVVGSGETETRHINKALSALADVLCALSSKQGCGTTEPDQLVPYRNSKLTRLLQYSLGGNSKTVFIVNVSANRLNAQETHMSLLYGQRAKTIKNVAGINRDWGGDSDLQKLHEQIEQLRRSLDDRTREVELLKQQKLAEGAEKERLRERLEDLSAKNREEQKRLEERISCIINTHSHELNDYRVKYLTLEQTLASFAQKVRELNVTLMMAEDERDDQSAKLAATKRRLAKAEAALEEERKRAEALERTAESNADRIAQLESELSALRSEKAALETRLADRNSAESERTRECSAKDDQIRALRRERDAAQSECRVATQRAERATNELAEVRKQLAAAEAQVRDKDREISELRARLHDAERAAKAAAKEVEAAKREAAKEKEKEMLSLRTKVEESESVRARVRQLEAELARSQAAAAAAAMPRGPRSSTAASIANPSTTANPQKSDNKVAGFTMETYKRKASTVKAANTDVSIDAKRDDGDSDFSEVDSDKQRKKSTDTGKNKPNRKSKSSTESSPLLPSAAVAGGAKKRSIAESQEGLAATEKEEGRSTKRRRTGEPNGNNPAKRKSTVSTMADGTLLFDDDDMQVDQPKPKSHAKPASETERADEEGSTKSKLSLAMSRISASGLFASQNAEEKEKKPRKKKSTTKRKSANKSEDKENTADNSFEFVDETTTHKVGKLQTKPTRSGVKPSVLELFRQQM